MTVVCPICWTEHRREELDPKPLRRPVNGYRFQGHCPLTGELLLLPDPEKEE